jgi:hypothetical protein
MHAEMKLRNTMLLDRTSEAGMTSATRGPKQELPVKVQFEIDADSRASAERFLATTRVPENNNTPRALTIGQLAKMLIQYVVMVERPGLSGGRRNVLGFSGARL